MFTGSPTLPTRQSWPNPRPMGVDVRIVWEVATVYVPEVCAVLERFFAEEGHASPSATP